ncbi:MAG: NAD-dependent deacylase [Planctomycetota bacterium]
MSDPADALAQVAGWLADARSVVALTGAGMSAESQIPTFRDTMDGLWASFDPQQLATLEAFEADPALVTRWYDERRVRCAVAEPNPGHTTLAAMERTATARGGSFTILTQNVDGLHRRAGSVNVLELHGSLFAWRGVRSGEAAELPDGPIENFPPRLPSGEPMRPGVVWFGEALPNDAIDAAFEASTKADVFLSIGTSSLVYPAAGFIDTARDAGAKTVEINPSETPLTPHVDASIRAKSGEALPMLMSLMNRA